MTPWNQDWAVAAYISYYFPLNWMRSFAVFQEGQRWSFFSGLENIIDFGSGLGSGSWPALVENKLSAQFIELSSVAQQIHRSLLALSVAEKEIANYQWLKQVGQNFLVPPASLGVFSYSLTEVIELPSWATQLEKLLIIEPATRDDGRRLMETRSKLLQQGWHIVAPCTHQGLCPLLTHSKSDWCHDRIHWKMPTWFQEIEKHLPIKNSTLTFSYLLATKTPSHQAKISDRKLTTQLARITGDHLPEKGKTRQLVCRGEAREYLAWMSRHGEFPEIPRGVLIEWPDDGESKSNEIRLRKNPKIL